uniref:Uncharacterized protein n=1 Tax=Oryza punctata TaxID=4537 RepID=A0A0E0MN12_ORYPU
MTGGKAASWGCALSAAGGSGSGRHGLRGIGDGDGWAREASAPVRSTAPPSPRSLRGDQLISMPSETNPKERE